MKKAIIKSMADVHAVDVEWLWKPYLPRGKVTIIRGMPGDGKSMFVVALIAALSTGRPLFNEENWREPIACVYQNAEDAVDDTIKPRLDSAAADCTRIFFIDEHDDPLCFTDERIEQTILEKNAGLFVLDPLQAYIGADVDMHRANEVRAVMNSLVDVAQRTKCAILLIEHLNKMKGGPAITRGLGSMDISGAARSVMLLGSKDDHSDEVYLAHVKCSLAPKGQTLVFTKEDNRMYFEGVSEISANQLLNCGDLPDYKPTKLDQVCATLQDVFQSADEILCQQIYDFFLENSISKRTVDEAKKKLGIQSAKRGNAWYWLRPQQSKEDCNIVCL